MHGDFQALHHFLRVEEEAMMEELKQEMEQILTGLEEHLEALQKAIRDAEQNIHTLRHTASCADQSVLVEVITLMLSSRSICQRANIGRLMPYLHQEPECWWQNELLVKCSYSPSLVYISHNSRTVEK